MDEQNKNMEPEHLVLRTEGLVKRYGKRTVVNDVSFDVKQGEIVGLLGPNGAGKTTSFYMTTGLIVPNEGHIYLGDEEVTTYPVYKRARAGIGYLAQEASVFRKMSVEDNILSVLEMTGKPREYQLEKLESLIKEFRLQKVRKNKGDQLSGGAPSYGDCPLSGYRAEIHHARRTVCWCGPHRCGRYPVYRVEAEGPEHRYPDYRP